MNANVNACPCCGGSARIEVEECEDGRWRIKCQRCGLQTPELYKLRRLIAIWNRRAPVARFMGRDAREWFEIDGFLKEHGRPGESPLATLSRIAAYSAPSPKAGQ